MKAVPMALRAAAVVAAVGAAVVLPATDASAMRPPPPPTCTVIGTSNGPGVISLTVNVTFNNCHLPVEAYVVGSYYKHPSSQQYNGNPVYGTGTSRVAWATLIPQFYGFQVLYQGNWQTCDMASDGLTSYDWTN